MKGISHADVGTILTKAEFDSESAHLVSSGTVFPATPAEKDRFYRTDLHQEYVYNGTAWIAINPTGISGKVLIAQGAGLDPTFADPDCTIVKVGATVQTARDWSLDFKALTDKTIAGVLKTLEDLISAKLEQTQYLIAPKLETEGYLTDSGWQYTDYVDTTTVDTYVTVAELTVEPPLSGSLIQALFELTASIKAITSATADITVKWEARNKDGTWVMISEIAYADVGTTYDNKMVRGVVNAIANFDAVPFQVKMSIKCNEANEGRGGVANRHLQYGATPGASDFQSVVRYQYKVVR